MIKFKLDLDTTALAQAMKLVVSMTRDNSNTLKTVTAELERQKNFFTDTK